jgi:hypothetical protein
MKISFIKRSVNPLSMMVILSLPETGSRSL